LSETIYTLLFEARSKDEIEHPDYYQQVGPVLKQMALLYPVMENLNPFYYYTNISKYLSNISMTMDKHILDQGFMPVTRELSHDTQEMVVNWCNSPIYMSENVYQNDIPVI